MSKFDELRKTVAETNLTFLNACAKEKAAQQAALQAENNRTEAWCSLQNAERALLTYIKASVDAVGTEP